MERGRDAEPSERRLSVIEAAREIGAIAPMAANQAELGVEDSRLAVLRRQVAPARDEEARAMRDWTVSHGSRAALSERLSQIDSGDLVIHHDPGAPALTRIDTIAEGIDRAIARQTVRNRPQPLDRHADRDPLER